MSTAWSRAAHLSDVEFDGCWELLGLGERPMALELRSPGRDADERRAVLAGVSSGLRARDLADRDGPAPILAAALRLLADPDYELDIRLAGQDGRTVGFGAVAGTRGVLVTQRGDRLAVLPIDGSRVLSGLVELAGPMSPGPGRPVNVAADVLDDALATEPATASALADQLRRRGVDRLDATSVAHLCRDVRSVGQLGATARLGGPARRAPWVVGFHATGAGHFLQLRQPGPTGGRCVTFAPLDAARLTARATELVDQVAHARAPGAPRRASVPRRRPG